MYNYLFNAIIFVEFLRNMNIIDKYLGFLPIIFSSNAFENVLLQIEKFKKLINLN